MIKFEEFIRLFNWIVKWLYHEINDTTNKIRNKIETYSDQEYMIINKMISEEIKKSDIIEKFAFKINDNLYLNLFVCNIDKFNLCCVKKSSVFENGISTIYLVVSYNKIKLYTSKLELYLFCHDLIDKLMSKVINEYILRLMLVGNEAKSLKESLSKIFAYIMVDDSTFIDKEYIDIADNILRYSTQNDYVQISPDKELSKQKLNKASP